VQLTRAIAAISMDGRMVTPHVADPSGLPKNYLEVNHYDEVKSVPVDPNGYTVITDAMSRVLLPEGTAPSAHIPGIDIAGKTGSAQVVSLATRAKHANDEDLAQNGWFVGFTPRRNPDVVVGILFQGGEHGKLAARLATQVIKAYVDKQRRQPTGLANEKPASNGKAEIGAIWTSPDEDGGQKLEMGHLAVALPRKPLPLAMAAPGMR
jgi:penicillin-binding protein 2